MALTVEDGTIVTGANSYVSLADAQQYATDRGLMVEQLTEPLLIKGFDYVNAYRERFRGEKLHEPQSNVQWPRVGAYIDNYLLAKEIVPECVVHAQIETAFEIANSRDPFETNPTRVLKKKRIGRIEYEYETANTGPSSSEIPLFDFKRVRALLRPVLHDTVGRTYR